MKYKKQTRQHGLLFIFSVLMVFLLSVGSSESGDIDVFSSEWSSIVKKASGQTVYFNAWGGSLQINQYIEWVKEQVKKEYNISLVHVLLQDSLEVARRIQQEKTAGSNKDGSVDLFWLNGNSFHLLKEQDLFLGNILDLLPNKKNIDPNNPVLYEDFTVSTEGLEVPWGTAQLGFFHRSAKVDPFYNLAEFKQTVKKNAGTFTYPSPVLDFTGRTFLKNLIYLFAEDKSVFYAPFTDTEAQKMAIRNNAVWDFLDELHPYLWKKGSRFPNSYAEMISLFKDSELHYGITFNPYDAVSKVLSGEFSDDVRMFLLEEGTVANAHFLTVPYNSSSKEAALVVIDFLISPKAQARKANPQYWGDPTVLDLNALNQAQQKMFDIKEVKHPAGPPSDLGKNTVKEFHSTWEQSLQGYWEQRYLK